MKKEKNQAFRHPWPTGRRSDALHVSAESRPPWRLGPHQDGLRAGANQSPPWDIALITGASSGIGEALARELAGRGVHVILAARRIKELRRIAMEIRSHGGAATAVKLDVSQTEGLEAKLATLDKKFGGIDLVIANAGVGVRIDAHPVQRTPRASMPFGLRADAPRVQRTPRASMPFGLRADAPRVQRTPRASMPFGLRADAPRVQPTPRASVPSWSWQAVEPALQTNFMGAIATITVLLPVMIARGSGHVVAICSLAGYGALPDAAGYVSPKAGLSRFMECLTLDLQGTGVVTSTVHVGFVATPMVAKSTIPLPFLMSAEKAAARIIDGLLKKKREINFPWLMVILVKAIALLPFALKAYAARRYYRKENKS